MNLRARGFATLPALRYQHLHHVPLNYCWLHTKNRGGKIFSSPLSDSVNGSPLFPGPAQPNGLRAVRGIVRENQAAG